VFLRELARQGRSGGATASPATVAILTAKLRRLIERWPSRQMNNPKLPWARLFAYAVVLMLGAVAVAWWWFLAWLIWRVI
jgi:hypothetical protein